MRIRQHCGNRRMRYRLSGLRTWRSWRLSERNFLKGRVVTSQVASGKGFWVAGRVWGGVCRDGSVVSLGQSRPGLPLPQRAPTGPGLFTIDLELEKVSGAGDAGIVVADHFFAVEAEFVIRVVEAEGFEGAL